MKAPAVIGERFIDADHLARHLFSAHIDTEVGREIGECTRAGARRTKGVIHDHEAIRGTDLPNGECLAIGEQDSLRVPKDSRSRSAKQHHHEPGVHDEGETTRTTETVCMQKEPAVALGVGGNAHLPAVALRLSGCGVGAVAKCSIHWQRDGEVNHAAPGQGLTEERVGLLGARWRGGRRDLRKAVPGADDDGDGQEHEQRREPG